MKTKKVEFTPPTGTVPEGTEAGGTFDVVCTFEVKEGGEVCLTKMGDTDMPGYGESKENGESKPQYRPGFDDMAQSISSGGGDSAAGGGY